MSPLLKIVGVLLLAGVVATGCRGPDRESGQSGFKPIDASAAVLWDRQTTENAEILHEIVETFNASHTGLPIKVVQSGNYSDIYKKVMASVRAGALPALAVTFETMTVEFVRAGAVVPIDDFLFDPEVGLTEAELADFIPVVIETNTYPELGGKMYSFPFTKSVLLLYYNRRVLNEAGIQAPPTTWDEFLDQCRTIKRVTGKYAWSIDIDPSAIDGLIYSMGGDLLDGRQTRFDSPEAIAVFELLETLVREDLIYQNSPRTFDDQNAFGRDAIAFNLRTSSSIPYIARLMEDDEAWGVAPIPQADPAHPGTVLYGANLCIFNTTPEQMSAAWSFIKYFTSPEVSARWALASGYLPLHQSAAEFPWVKASWERSPPNRIAFECLAFARPEPNIIGWQEVRGAIQKAVTSVITQMQSGRAAALELKREADAILAAR